MMSDWAVMDVYGPSWSPHVPLHYGITLALLKRVISRVAARGSEEFHVFLSYEGKGGLGGPRPICCISRAGRLLGSERLPAPSLSLSRLSGRATSDWAM